MTPLASKAWWLGLLLLCDPLLCVGSPRPRVLSVCDVLQNPARLRGRVLSIRGFAVATEEGSWLGGDCRDHLVTKGLTWPNTIWLLVTGGTDFAGLERIRKQISRERSSSADRVWITYVGMLETKSSIEEEVGLDDKGGPHRLGFGHLNDAPAQLDVRTAKDVVIERRRPSE